VNQLRGALKAAGVKAARLRRSAEGDARRYRDRHWRPWHHGGPRDQAENLNSRISAAPTDVTWDEDERIGVDFVHRACGDPACGIASNAGHEGSIVASRIKVSGDRHWGFNAQTKARLAVRFLHSRSGRSPYRFTPLR
jgi:hypothetical protein